MALSASECRFLIVISKNMLSQRPDTNTVLSVVFVTFYALYLLVQTYIVR